MLSVIMMAPSSGLITLTIPDESSSAASIPDTQHISKRVTDDVRYIAFDAIGAVAEVHPRFLNVDAVAHTAAIQAPAPLSHEAQIRGPPLG